jgi:hypothetical protein
MTRRTYDTIADDLQQQSFLLSGAAQAYFPSCGKII